MSDLVRISRIQPIHPFPARMATSIVWESLPAAKKPLRILDPMAGSGTTLVVAKARGHQAIGYDTDPLATLISRVWCSEVDAEVLTSEAHKVLGQARGIGRTMSPQEAYPCCADEETKKFIDFWFDQRNRVQLTALAHAISHVSDPHYRNLLWVAFSRLIITKKIGVSLAMDVSHSRPHRKYRYAPMEAFDAFMRAVDYIRKKAPFHTGCTECLPAIIARGDARCLPLSDSTVDMVVTSPPYLNAIDYLRGHRLSLVWMGYSITELRRIRASNIGAERPLYHPGESVIPDVLNKMGQIEQLDRRLRAMVTRFIYDMGLMLAEIHRVLVPGGEAIFVVGDSAVRGVFVRNSVALKELAAMHNFRLLSEIARPISERRRYLPPPSSEKAGGQMRKRMRQEVVLRFVLPSKR